ncbi:MAG: hypothetical protein ACLU4N_12650 [Butyricimonas faecihominis]
MVRLKGWSRASGDETKNSRGYNELGVSDIKNGQFEFKGKIAEIQSVQLFLTINGVV